MRISFEVDGRQVLFERNWFTGAASLVVDGEKSPLQSPWRPTTHYSLATTRVWEVQVGSRDVRIEKIRPWLLAGFRPQMYRIVVDGDVLVERSGY